MGRRIMRFLAHLAVIYINVEYCPFWIAAFLYLSPITSRREEFRL